MMGLRDALRRSGASRAGAFPSRELGNEKNGKNENENEKLCFGSCPSVVRHKCTKRSFSRARYEVETS